MVKRLFIGILACFLALGAGGHCFAEDLGEVAQEAFSGVSQVFSENLNSSQVLGNPIYVGKQTIIPVICKGIGYGFGTKLEDKDKHANKSNAKSAYKNEKDRLGIGAGGFARPVALIFINADGRVRVEKLNEGFVAQLAKHVFPQFARLVKDVVKLKARKYFHKKIRPFKNKKPIMLKKKHKRRSKKKSEENPRKDKKD
jgi:uncharacterized spore protein YtfJ